MMGSGSLGKGGAAHWDERHCKVGQLSEAVVSKYTLGFTGKFFSGLISLPPALVSDCFPFRTLLGKENLNCRFET